MSLLITGRKLRDRRAAFQSLRFLGRGLIVPRNERQTRSGPCQSGSDLGRSGQISPSLSIEHGSIAGELGDRKGNSEGTRGQAPRFLPLFPQNSSIARMAKCVRLGECPAGTCPERTPMIFARPVRRPGHSRVAVASGPEANLVTFLQRHIGSLNGAAGSRQSPTTAATHTPFCRGRACPPRLKRIHEERKGTASRPPTSPFPTLTRP